MKIEMTFTEEEILAALRYKYAEVSSFNWQMFFHSKDLKADYQIDKIILKLKEN